MMAFQPAPRVQAQERQPSRDLCRGRRIFVSALMLLIAAPLLAACEKPYLTTITLDGALEDWAPVLSSSRNVTVDGDGMVVPCGGTPDRDCPVNGGSKSDLRRFAWTYDDTRIYFFAERFGSGPASDYFYLHLDLDYDGLMSAGADRLLLFQLDSARNEISLSAFDYIPADPSGDPLADSGGQADGYALPGLRGSLRYSDFPRATVSADDERFEAGIAWADLALPGTAPIGFHLGLHNRSDRENLTSDNLGAPDQGPGTTGFRAHDLSPSHTGAIPTGGGIRYAHRVVNEGNLPDTYALRAVSSKASELRIHSDPDGDGDPADGVLLGVDGRGDGDFVDVGDLLSGDTDGDTFPDSGPIPPGGIFDFVVEIRPRGGLRGVVDLVDVHATATGGGCEQEVRDQTAIGDLALLPEWSFMAEPGASVGFPHEIRNHSPDPMCIDLLGVSGLGWTYQIWSDPDGDGDSADGSVLTDTCGDPPPDLQVPAGETRHFVALADIPLGTALGALESLRITASARAPGNPNASVTDTLTVAETLSLAPSYLLAIGKAKNAVAGVSLFFRHTLTHAGPAAESFALTATPPPGNHALTLLTDPNGDGLPGDGQVIPDGSLVGPLGGFGGTLPLIARLDVDPATPHDTILSFDVTATSETNPNISRTATDEAVVSLIAAYADERLLLQENTYPRCGRVYAKASGLVPAQGDRYRFRWIERNGPLNLRVTSFTSDAAGESTDALYVDTSFTPGDYAVLLEEWDGLQWSELDRDDILLQDFLRFMLLSTDRTSYSPAAQTLLSIASFENAGPRALQDVEIRYLVRDPAGHLYLQPDGLFFMHTPGDWTWVSGPFSLAAGEPGADAFGVGPIEFPFEGTYSLEVHAVGTCGESMASLSTTFEVMTDSDGDGWSDADEIALGSDPNDRDTDDDGILDSEDGSGDADGDTLVDARDCDADGDTLPDSVEEGLDGLALDAHTDLGAGCFRADGDGGATTTDRLDADTDRGGEADGVEDANRDGVYQAGEKDPLDLTDDPCSWLPPPEANGLRVERRGNDLLLTWSDLSGSDPCVAYRVLTATEGAPGDISFFSETGSGLLTPVWLDTGAGTDGTNRYYLAAGRGRIGGNGLLGHYLE